MHGAARRGSLRDQFAVCLGGRSRGRFARRVGKYGVSARFGPEDMSTQYPAGFCVRECTRLSCFLDDIGRLPVPTALPDPGHGRSERRNSCDRPCLSMHPAPRARSAKLDGSRVVSVMRAPPAIVSGGSGLQPQLWPCSTSMKAPTEWPGKLREERRASSSSYGKDEARDPPGTELRVCHSDEGPCAKTGACMANRAVIVDGRDDSAWRPASLRCEWH